MASRTFIVTFASMVLLPNLLHAAVVSDAEQEPDSGACGLVLSLTCAGPAGSARLLIKVGDSDRYWELVVPAAQRSAVIARIGESPSGRLVCLASDVERSLVTSMVLRRPEQLIVKNDVQVAEYPRTVLSTCDPSVQAPVPTREVHPQYTALDLRAGIDGAVLLHAVVDEQGRVVEIRVVRSLSAGLDGESTKAFAQWRFRPAMRRGTPVAVAVTGEFQFRIGRPH